MKSGECGTTNEVQRSASCSLPLPSWVDRLCGGWTACDLEHVALCDDRRDIPVSVHRSESDRFAVLSVVIEQATDLPPVDFQKVTANAYLHIARIISAFPARYPVRFWNFIPAIHEQLGDDLDRYMVFNAGRFAAYWEWFGCEDSFVGTIPTATGIGHEGEDLVIHLLACDTPGGHIENPRQKSSSRYSQRFGPLPPCFARATVLNGLSTPYLIVGGTASVRGEDSLFEGDPIAQTNETLTNISCLIGDSTATIRPECVTTESNAAKRRALLRLSHLRIYHHPSIAVDDLLSFVQEKTPQLEQGNLEIFPAKVCRSELLVEIEGIARLGSE